MIIDLATIGSPPPQNGLCRAWTHHAIQPTAMETYTVRCQVEWIGSAKSYAVVYAWMEIGEDGGGSSEMAYSLSLAACEVETVQD